MTTEKSYLLDLLSQHRDALARTSDPGWRMSHHQHIERLQKQLEREIREED
jgi:hypothetical protein